MNKTDLVNSISQSTGFTKKDAEKALDATIASITNAMQNGDKVQLVGFGSFEVRTRAERTGRNPQTGTPMTIAATKAPVFKAGKVLKDSVK